jgi:hypothetical protein
VKTSSCLGWSDCQRSSNWRLSIKWVFSHKTTALSCLRNAAYHPARSSEPLSRLPQSGRHDYGHHTQRARRQRPTKQEHGMEYRCATQFSDGCSSVDEDIHHSKRIHGSENDWLPSTTTLWCGVSCDLRLRCALSHSGRPTTILLVRANPLPIDE